MPSAHVGSEERWPILGRYSARSGRKVANLGALQRPLPPPCVGLHLNMPSFCYAITPRLVYLEIGYFRDAPAMSDRSRFLDDLLRVQTHIQNALADPSTANNHVFCLCTRCADVRLCPALLRTNTVHRSTCLMHFKGDANPAINGLPQVRNRFLRITSLYCCCDDL